MVTERVREMARIRNRHYRMRHPERGREYLRQWRLIHPDYFRIYSHQWRTANLEKARESVRRWARANPEKILQLKRQWAAANSEKIRAWYRRWRLTNPFKAQERNRRRRVRLAGNGIESVSIDRIIIRDGMICHLCGKSVIAKEFSLDHVIPVSRGGRHAENNLRIAHRRCNSRRRDKPLPWVSGRP